MPRVMIRCPTTGELVPTGLDSDGGPDFRRRLPSSGSTLCSACRRVHAWHRPEAILEGSTRRERTEIG